MGLCVPFIFFYDRGHLYPHLPPLHVQVSLSLCNPPQFSLPAASTPRQGLCMSQFHLSPYQGPTISLPPEIQYASINPLLYQGLLFYSVFPHFLLPHSLHTRASHLPPHARHCFLVTVPPFQLSSQILSFVIFPSGR